MRVECATMADIPNWLLLAAEVEGLFGSLVDNPGFRRALTRNIERGTAYCVREHQGVLGNPLKGGLLWSPRPPCYAIGWLAVANRWQRHGVGRSLVEHVCGLVQAPAGVTVVTFGEDTVAGRPARDFYQRLGFTPAEPVSNGPEGGLRQVFRRLFDLAE